MNYVMPDPPIEGWMSKDELDWLYEQAQQMDSIVEIGSWFGRSTHALCSGCPGIVYAVDHFRGSPGAGEHRFAHDGGDVYAKFMANVGHFPNLRVFRYSSREAASCIGLVDMVFVDGDHRFEPFSEDLALWKPKAMKLFCGHDRTQDGIPRALVESGIGIREGPGCLWIADETRPAFTPSTPLDHHRASVNIVLESMR